MMTWIKVKDKLPPTDTPLLLYAGRIAFGEYIFYDPHYRWCEFQVGYISDVTHWMPLPCRPEDE